MNRPGRGSIGAPPLSRKEIVTQAEALAARFLLDFWKGRVQTRLVCISFDAVYDNLIYPEYEIGLIEDEDLGVSDTGEKILGRYDPHSNTAYIDHSLRNDPRRAFTCWHEVAGHGVLQGEWLRQRRVQNSGVVTTQSTLSPMTVNTLERQANIFAAHAAIPTALLAQAIIDVFDPDGAFEYRGPGRYTFSVNRRTLRRDIADFTEYAWMVSSFLRNRFGWISAECISYRLQDIRFVRDVSVNRLELHRTARARRAVPIGWAMSESPLAPAAALRNVAVC